MELSCSYIPEELLSLILLSLRVREITNFSFSCKTSYKICSSDYLFHLLLERDFPFASSSERLSVLKIKSKKEYYKLLVLYVRLIEKMTLGSLLLSYRSSFQLYIFNPFSSSPLKLRRSKRNSHLTSKLTNKRDYYRPLSLLCFRREGEQVVKIWDGKSVRSVTPQSFRSLAKENKNNRVLDCKRTEKYLSWIEYLGNKGIFYLV
jgi:hypothetical protein